MVAFSLQRERFGIVHDGLNRRGHDLPFKKKKKYIDDYFTAHTKETILCSFVSFCSFETMRNAITTSLLTSCFFTWCERLGRCCRRLLGARAANSRPDRCRRRCFHLTCGDGDGDDEPGS